MPWTKLGRIYEPLGKRDDALLTHASNPVAVELADGSHRIYFSGRDSRNRSSVGAITFNFDSMEVLEDSKPPLFRFGEPGTFFSHGVSVGSYYSTPEGDYLLFMGWQAPAGGHWRGDIGRLKVQSNGDLILDPPGPYIGPSIVDPISTSYPWVQKLKEGGYTIYYGSTLTWDGGNGEMHHVINHGTSSDGRDWKLLGQAVPSTLGVAQAFSRPTVIQLANGDLEMWFSYRSGSGSTYRIGRAVQKRGSGWILDLESKQVEPSLSGWDSEMVEYPFVFVRNGKRHMLYNGNSFGLSGFGLAVFDEE